MKAKLLFLVMFLPASFPGLLAQEASSSDYQDITIRQKKDIYELKTGMNELDLKRKPFDIEFDLESGANDSEWNNWTVLQVAATINPDMLQYFCESPVSNDNNFIEKWEYYLLNIHFR
ncbi:MAG: hypothetical protein JW801_03750 [Bacteroidales bacterium]|nr:hypothetical protein [Bacteroidales bacterium]